MLNLYYVIKKNKWLLCIILAIALLILLNVYNPLEHIENVSSSSPSPSSQQTVRKLEDYFTVKTASETKIISLKCKIDGKDYYVGNVDKKKFNESCPICSTTAIKDSMLVLVNSKMALKNNCYEEELVKCFNTQTIADCQEHALKECDQKKIGFSNLEFVLDNIVEGTIVDGVKTQPSFILKLNDPKLTGAMLSILEMKSSTNTTEQTKKLHLICLDKVIGTLDEKQKIYLDTTGLAKDKIRFKIFFKIEGKNKYLGVCNGDLCPNIICKEPSCDNKETCCIDDYKFFCLYDEMTNTNVLNFEPELVRFVK
jgi:hypothetical protein